MRISIIAAIASNGVIGRDNALPWRLKPDLARFKSLTMGHSVIMGRRTWESIGRPLAGRSIIVLSARPGFAPEGAATAASLDQALGLASGDEVFVAGGAAVYHQAIPRADRMYLTRLERSFEGDALFPDWDQEGWRLVEETTHDAAGDAPAFSFLTYDRARPAGARGRTP